MNDGQQNTGQNTGLAKCSANTYLATGTKRDDMMMTKTSWIPSTWSL